MLNADFSGVWEWSSLKAPSLVPVYQMPVWALL